MSFPLERVSALRILVVGDVMLDRYVQGSVGRISPEAPVPVVKFGREWSSPGGAAHVAACVAGLGCQVVLGGVVGQDQEAPMLRDELRSRGVSETTLLPNPDGRTITKTRILASNSQQLLRLDQESDEEGFAAPALALCERMGPSIAACDALVLADYDKGTLTAATIPKLIEEAKRLGKPVIVDPKKADFHVYQGASVLTPNVAEMERACGRKLASDADIEAAAGDLRAACALDVMLVTRGPHGMTGVDAAGAFRIPARVREVADVTGAGDTVVAVLAMAIALGVDMRSACAWASAAAGIAVSRAGTYVVAGEELRTALAGHPHKIVTWEAAKIAVERERRRGRRIVFTNGCFDLLHAGHLHSLREARALGDLLVVGLNSDASVRALNGPSRPIVPHDQRAFLLAGLDCVDLIVPFDEPTPEPLIRHLAPHVLTKGGDYDPATIAGSEFVRSQGGTVERTSIIAGLSTTALLKKLRDDEERQGG